MFHGMPNPNIRAVMRQWRHTEARRAWRMPRMSAEVAASRRAGRFAAPRLGEAGAAGEGVGDDPCDQVDVGTVTNATEGACVRRTSRPGAQ